MFGSGSDRMLSGGPEGIPSKGCDAQSALWVPSSPVEREMRAFLARRSLRHVQGPVVVGEHRTLRAATKDVELVT